MGLYDYLSRRSNPGVADIRMADEGRDPRIEISPETQHMTKDMAMGTAGGLKVLREGPALYDSLLAGSKAASEASPVIDEMTEPGSKIIEDMAQRLRSEDASKVVSSPKPYMSGKSLPSAPGLDQSARMPAGTSAPVPSKDFLYNE